MRGCLKSNGRLRWIRTCILNGRKLGNSFIRPHRVLFVFVFCTSQFSFHDTLTFHVFTDTHALNNKTSIWHDDLDWTPPRTLAPCEEVYTTTLGSRNPMKRGGSVYGGGRWMWALWSCTVVEVGSHQKAWLLAMVWLATTSYQMHAAVCISRIAHRFW